MGPLEHRQIARHSILWKSENAGPWLVTFDFAEIAGRVECVGVSVRSYIHDRAEGPEGVYPAYWDGEPVGYQWFVDHLGSERHPLEELDRDALDAEAAADPGMVPRVLRAATMRELPFGDVLRRVLDKVTREYLDEMMPPDTVLEAGDEGIREWQDECAGAFRQRSRRGVKEARYSDDDLRKVAAVYSGAFEAGSKTPTKDVAASLGFPYSSAAKLVMRCRRRGLLGPTEKSHAGGILPPDTPTERGTM
jgi:hypothetical protein